MVLLRATVQGASQTILREYCSTWTGLAVSLMQRGDQHTKEVCADILGHTLDFGRLEPELRREMSSNHLPTVLNGLLAVLDVGIAPPATATVLATLGVCATLYPGPTRPFAARVRTVVHAAFDSPSAVVATAAAKCYACLPRCASAKALSTTWHQAVVAAIGSMHDICSVLFEGADEEELNGSWQKLDLATMPLGDVPELPKDRIPLLLRRFEAICACVKNLLTFKADFTTAVPVEALLVVICRCLAVNWDSWKDGTASAITGLLPRLHCQMLGLLQTLLT